MRPMSNKVVLVAIAGAWLCAQAAHAVVVLPKGSDRPVMGYLVRQDERTVVVRQPQPGGKSREIPFSKADLDELIITVLPERLAELDPARPQPYREYAEELAEKQRDPEARDMAIRLYAIAAARGDERLRYGALLGLISLARGADEERRFRAAAFLYDPAHDAAILVAPTAAARGALSPPSAELLSVLRLARQGKGSTAKVILDRPEVKAEASQFSAVISLEDLMAACTARQLSPQQLLQLLKAELALEDTPAPLATAPGSAAQPATWSQAAATDGHSPLPLLSLDKLTEFDPAECFYKGGKWVQP
jgi:hypothetical protein